MDSVYVSTQFFDYYKSKGFYCIWDEKSKYVLSGYIIKNKKYYAFLYKYKNEKPKKLQFESIRIPQKLFPKEDFLIKVSNENINTYRDMEGKKIISVFIDTLKWYKAIKINENEILFLDDIGNQVFLYIDEVKEIKKYKTSDN
jgi:hypothetical protein